MASQIEFQRVAPVIPVRDLNGALERYRRLGFTVRPYEGPEPYGFVDRGGVSLHLSEWAEHDPARTGSQVYLYVSNADELHAEWKAAEVEGRLADPHDTPYGLREFAYVDPDGTLHRAGSPSQARPPDDVETAAAGRVIIPSLARPERRNPATLEGTDGL